MRLTLVRHGETASNVLGLLDTGVPGPGLTDAGLRQADGLREHFGDAPVDAVYVSRLVRTHHTAAPLAAHRGIRPVELAGVHEVEAGALELLGDPDSVRTYLETVAAWALGDLAVRMPGGADGHAFFGRFDTDVARVARESEHAVLVSHGAAIRTWVGGRAVNVERGFTTRVRLPNAAVVELEGTPEDGWRLVTWPADSEGSARALARRID